MRTTHLSIAVSDERTLREAIMCRREHEKGTGTENSTEQGKNLTRIGIGKGKGKGKGRVVAEHRDRTARTYSVNSDGTTAAKIG